MTTHESGSGFLHTLDALASSVLSLFHASAADLAATVSPGWSPGEAHFTGKLPGRAAEEGWSADDSLEVLAREIAARRAARGSAR